MGLLSTFLGSKSGSKTNSTQNIDSTTTGTSEQTQSTGSSQQTAGTTQSNIAQLDQGTIDAIKNILPTLTNNVAQGGSDASTAGLDKLNSFLDTLSTRAQNEGQDTTDAINAAQAAAKLDFQNTTAPQIAQAQQNVGGRFGNSFSQLIENKGQQDLTTQLNQISTSGILQGKQQQSADLATVLGGLTNAPQIATQAGSGTTTDLTNLLGVLKGANTTQTGSDTSSKTLQQLIDSLTQSDETTNQDTTATGATSGTARGSLLSGLVSIFK